MNKPPILIIENSVAITGALKSLVRSSQQLSKHFHFLFLLPKKSAAIKLVQSAGFEVYQMGLRELRKSFFDVLQYLPALIYNSFALKKIVREHKINLIVVNDFYNLVPATFKMLDGPIPYICYVRFLPSKFPATLVKFWCAWHRRYASAIVAVSKVVEKELPYRDSVIVIGNELPSEEIRFVSAKKSTTILYPANYIPGKGQEYALESWALISEKHPQWKLKFVGSDMGLSKNNQYKQSLIALSQNLQLGHRVEWGGFSEKISDEYLDAEIILNFSQSESFSLTCLEAMFYGRPVIATRSGGPSEIIDDNVTGILVHLNDISAMAKAMDYLISNPSEREAMAHRAFESVREKFSYDKTIGKLGELYAQVLHEPS